MLILYLVSKILNTKFKLLNNFFQSALDFVNLVLKLYLNISWYTLLKICTYFSKNWDIDTPFEY